MRYALVLLAVAACGCEASLRDFAPLEFVITGENPLQLTLTLVTQGECRPFRLKLLGDGFPPRPPLDPERVRCSAPAWDLSAGTWTLDDGSAQARMTIDYAKVTLQFEDGSSVEVAPHPHFPRPQLPVRVGSEVVAVPDACAREVLEAQLAASGFVPRGDGTWSLTMPPNPTPAGLSLEYQSVCVPACDAASCAVERPKDFAGVTFIPR